MKTKKGVLQTGFIINPDIFKKNVYCAVIRKILNSIIYIHT